MKTNNLDDSSQFPPIAVFGASRGVGRQVVQQAVQRGQRVIAVARNGASLKQEFPNLTVVEGDAADPRVVRTALSQVHAVICTLGAPAFSGSKIRSEGTAAIIAGMEARGLKRLLVLSLLGVLESRASLPWMIRYLMFPLYLRRPVADHERQERLLEQSSLDWTAVRPPFLIEGAQTGEYAHGFVDDTRHLALKISRADAAHFMLAQVAEQTYVEKPVGISYERGRVRVAQLSLSYESQPIELSKGEHRAPARYSNVSFCA